jgi:prepilin-type N-terminal cleavage/methylation domain-containing protein
MISETHNSNAKCSAFTLFELMIVLVIIASMVTIVVPYATRSNEALRTKQECLSLADTIRYMADLAEDMKRSTRILLNPQSNSYMLEISSGADNQDYEPMEAFGNALYYFSQNIRITDVAGFSFEGNNYCLVFEPTRPWPNASISLSTRDEIKTIVIRGRRVQIEESTI